MCPKISFPVELDVKKGVLKQDFCRSDTWTRGRVNRPRPRGQSVRYEKMKQKLDHGAVVTDHGPWSLPVTGDLNLQ
jgi:hypothetical protein